MIQNLLLVSFLLLSILLIYITKDIFSPPVLLSSLYFFVLLVFVIMKFLTKSTYDMKPLSFYFLIGTIIFSASFLLFNIKKSYLKETQFSFNYSMTNLLKAFIVVQGIVCVLFLLYSIYITKLELNNEDTILRQYFLTLNSFRFRLPYIFALFRTISGIILCILFSTRLNKQRNKKDDIWFLFQLCITLIFIIFSVGKHTIFILMIPMFFIYILLDKRKPFEKISLLFILGVCLLGLFVLLNMIRSNFTLSILDNILYLRHYLCSGMIVFVEWVEQGFEHTNGIYTFRFPLVVLNKLFHTNFNTLWVCIDYIKNVNIDWDLGNVWSFYHGFAQDFGLWFGLFMSAFIGCIHGLLYNLTYKYKKLFFFVLYTQLMFPLLTQFFSENYFSHLSLYVQVIIILFLFTNTKLLYINNNEVLSNDKSKSK